MVSHEWIFSSSLEASTVCHWNCRRTWDDDDDDDDDTSSSSIPSYELFTFTLLGIQQDYSCSWPCPIGPNDGCTYWGSWLWHHLNISKPISSWLETYILRILAGLKPLSDGWGNSTFADAKRAILERLRQEGSSSFQKFYFAQGPSGKTARRHGRLLQTSVCTECYQFFFGIETLGRLQIITNACLVVREFFVRASVFHNTGWPKKDIVTTFLGWQISSGAEKHGG